MGTPCYIFDIDGTLADLSHRLHHILETPKNWDAFFDACGEDKPIEHVCGLARLLGQTGTLILVSGRSERCRFQTVTWLQKHKIDCLGLYMRKNGDHRPDNIVKGEILDKILNDGFSPIMAFEDRDQVVKMWRERGIPCAQVAEGNF